MLPDGVAHTSPAADAHGPAAPAAFHLQRSSHGPGQKFRIRFYIVVICPFQEISGITDQPFTNADIPFHVGDNPIAAGAAVADPDHPGDQWADPAHDMLDIQAFRARLLRNLYIDIQQLRRAVVLNFLILQHDESVFSDK
jgi:hypothetical protein